MNPRVFLFIPIINENSFLIPRCELWWCRNGNNKWQDQTLFKGTVSRKSYFVKSFPVESIELISFNLHLIFLILLIRTLISLLPQLFLCILYQLYCSSGSGSNCGKVSILVPVPDPDPDTILHSFSKTKNFCTKSAFSISKASLFPRKFASHFWFFDRCIQFHVGSGSRSGSANAKVVVAVLVPVLRHCFLHKYLNKRQRNCSNMGF